VKALVAVLLIAVEPLHFSGEIIALLPTLAYRGWIALAELAVHAGVAALCVMAGFALLNDSPDGRRIATLALVASFLRVLQSTWWSALPDNTMPGDEPLKVAIAAAAAGIALLIVRRR
jgi:hypothetical protein